MKINSGNCLSKIVTISVLSIVSVLFLQSVVRAAEPDENTQNLVCEIYIATFGRAPAYAGLMYWADAVYSGSFTIDQVAQSFFDQPETQEKFPEGSSNTGFITTIFYNVLNRAPAETGLAYWVDALDRGLVRRDQAIMAIINGAKAATGSAEDAALLAKKTEIGVLFANSDVGSMTDDKSFMDWATDIISFTASDDFNLEEAEEYISNIESTYNLLDYKGPLTEGNIWLYSGNGWDGMPADIYIEIISTQKTVTFYTDGATAKPYTANVIDIHNDDNGNINPDHSYTSAGGWNEYYTKTDGLRLWGHDDDGESIRVDKGLNLGSTIALGQDNYDSTEAYLNGSYVGSVNMNVSLLDVSDVTVPAGTFCC